MTRHRTVGGWVAGACAALALAGSARAEEPKVFAYIVADTKSNLRYHVQRDRNTVADALSAAVPKGRLVLNYLEDENASKAGIERVLKNFPKNSQHTLIVAVTCHGKTAQKNNDTHTLLLHGAKPEGEELLRSDLRAQMLAQKARLTILLTDACSPADAEEPKEIKIRPPGGGVILAESDPIPAGYQKLFFEAEGLVDVNAVSEGLLAWSDTTSGGVFLRSFKTTLERVADDKNINWPTLYMKARDQTEETYKKFRQGALDEFKNRETVQGKLNVDQAQIRDLLRGQSTHTPQAYFLPGLKLGLAADPGDDGVVVTNLTQDSPLRKAGLRKGDLILKFDDAPTPGTNALVAAATELQKSGKTQFPLTIKDTEGKTRILKVDLSK